MKATDEELDILRVRLCRVETPSTAHMMSVEKYCSLTVMLHDLRKLALVDGCIAAAWALETLYVLTEPSHPEPRR
jgi:hypothetical protein